MYRRNDSGDSTAPCGSACHGGAESPLSPLSRNLAGRFDRESRNQRAKGVVCTYVFNERAWKGWKGFS